MNNLGLGFHVFMRITHLGLTEYLMRAMFTDQAVPKP